MTQVIPYKSTVYVLRWLCLLRSTYCIVQAIKKVLDENSYFGEEEHSQALLFKSLWLEAEAKLYSISYRARFDRMKIEMERLKVKQEKGNDVIL